MNKKGKLKVGDWVKVKGFEHIGKIATCGGTTYQGLMIDNFAYLNNSDIRYCWFQLTKLPIKFKGFEIVLEQVNDQMRWDCHRAPKGLGYISFGCVKVGELFHVGISPKGKYLSADFPTIDQAKDWLELEYTTMLAKARGLI